MADEKKRDPFKPAQPAIPGIPSDEAETVALPAASAPAAAKPASPGPSPVLAPAPPKAATPPKPPSSSSVPKKAPEPTLAQKLNQQMMPILMGLIALTIFVVMAVVWKSKQSAADDTPPPVAEVPAAASDARPAPVSAPTDEPTAPGVIAKAEELSTPWAAKNFIYRNEATGELTPAMVVHLPRGGYWAFSLIEPYGRCRLEFVTDLQKLAKEYEYPADHPLVGDPCSHTLFDLLRYGGPMNGEVRGDIVHGSAMRPPIAIEIQTRGKDVLAVKMEE